MREEEGGGGKKGWGRQGGGSLRGPLLSPSLLLLSCSFDAMNSADRTPPPPSKLIHPPPKNAADAASCSRTSMRRGGGARIEHTWASRKDDPTVVKPRSISRAAPSMLEMRRQAPTTWAAESAREAARQRWKTRGRERLVRPGGRAAL
eukprot:513578-Hanusia_phi.AAC.2